MFITFEGPEGSGKTTQIALLAEFLREQGFPIITTREPGGTTIGNQIRDRVLDVANVEMTAVAEILLYSASRAQLVHEVIKPALASGKVVICDRYADSTMAYQGYARGLRLEDLTYITRFATGNLQPDLTILLDLAVEMGLKRRTRGGDEMNRMDLQTTAFHQRVRQGYLALAKAEPERWAIVDANRSVGEIHCDVQEIVKERLKI